MPVPEYGEVPPLAVTVTAVESVEPQSVVAAGVAVEVSGGGIFIETEQEPVHPLASVTVTV
jgi:hypothetical protein